MTGLKALQAAQCGHGLFEAMTSDLWPVMGKWSGDQKCTNLNPQCFKSCACHMC